ncbi:MAG: type II/IV secretion system ATPase subunit, partial [Thermoplasmata archaeon]|nr:type II/IV secretion system ATPase subunit [Thermoplasmata archaeon]
PEYIIVGEIRGREAYVLFQAMATGHTTYSTMHADSPQSLIHRLESKPMNVPRIMIQSLDFICFHSIVRMKNKRVRKITRVIEIIDIDPLTKEIITNEVFSWDPVTDTFRYSGRSYILEKIRSNLSISKEDIMKELNRRMRVVNWLIKKGRISFRDSAQIIEEYRERPNELLKRVDKDD